MGADVGRGVREDRRQRRPPAVDHLHCIRFETNVRTVLIVDIHIGFKTVLIVDIPTKLSCVNRFNTSQHSHDTVWGGASLSVFVAYSLCIVCRQVF